MAETARSCLGTTDQFDAIVHSQVPHPTYTDEQAKNNGDFVERLTDNGIHTGLVVIAPHGGAIERHTDEQAEYVEQQLAAKGVSFWRFKGWKRKNGKVEAFDMWHITSIVIHDASFPLLNTIINRSFTYAVAFYGFDQQGILIGGGADEALKCEIKSAIQQVIGSSIEDKIATEVDNLNGDNLLLIVIRLASSHMAKGHNGIQIEQSLKLRENFGQEIADAVASV